MAINKKKRKKIILLAVLAAVLIIIGACAVWLATYYRADMDAIVSYSDDHLSSVVQDTLENGDIAFMSTAEPEYGIIFYPGARVEHTAYIPLMKKLAEDGILTYICRMPLNLALLDMNAAENALRRYPGVEHWYLAGHSMGGVAAAKYLAHDPGRFDGLILLAAYSADDLTETDLKVLSVCGSEDGVMNWKKYKDSLSNLPDGHLEYVIDGGCHAYFGMYGRHDPLCCFSGYFSISWPPVTGTAWPVSYFWSMM